MSDGNNVTINGTSGQPWPTLSIGAIAIDPSNTNTIYVGTGEANLNGDAFAGDGILKSTDGGSNWTEYGFNDFAGLGIAKIAVDPFSTSTLFAAVAFDGFTQPPTGGNLNDVGIWISTDAGQSWTQVISDGDNLDGWDLIFDAASSTTPTVYAGVGSFGLAGLTGTSSKGGIWKGTYSSVTSAWSFAQLTSGGIPSGTLVERVGLGISSSGAGIYAVMATNDSATANNPNFGTLLNEAIYESVDSGTTWASIDISGVGSSSNNNQMWNDDGEKQWWYDLAVGVDPNDAATVYVAGVDLWQGQACTTSGTPACTWTNLTNVYSATPTGPHPDNHAIAFIPGATAGTYTSNYLIGNDGGVWSGTKAGTFTDLNNGGLNITQFYGGSVGEIGPDQQLYGGAQDNGEDQFQGSPGIASSASQWNEAFGGDGFFTAVDFTNNANVYEEYAYGNINNSTDGGVTWNPAVNGIGTEQTNFSAPLVMSPNNANLLLAGTTKVYRTTNGAGSWSAISPVFDGTPISALAIGTNNSYLYAGTNFGDIYASSNGGSSWHVPSTNPDYTCFNGIVTGLTVDPTNPSVAYATCAGFAATSGQHVYKTTNNGGSWTDVSGSLPNIGFESVVVSPANHSLVIAGSDAGIFISPDAGSTWQQLGSGLPPVAVDQIFFNHSGTELYVATHGRGMWELTFPHIQLSTQLLASTAVSSAATPPAQAFTVANTGTGPLAWSAANVPAWVSLSATSGTLASGASQTLTASFDMTQCNSSNGQASGPNSEIACDGSITFHGVGADNDGLTLPVAVVSAQVSKTWYFAEGFTGSGATEYLTIANPAAPGSGMTASVTVTYLLGPLNGTPQAPIVKHYSIPAGTRFTRVVNDDVGANQNVSMVVSSDHPVVAERPYYVTYRGSFGSVPGSSDVLGATSLATQFDFGYVDTSTNHDTWLTILNNNASSMTATIQYFPAAGGTPITIPHTVPANSRGTVYVNGESGLPHGVYSALVSLSAPGLVERPLYMLHDSVTGYPGSADVVGVAQPQTNWYFAEGYASSLVNERYILANPTTASGTVNATVTFYRADGSSVPVNVTLNPGQQQVVVANTYLGNNKVDNSAVVTASAPILAERLMSFTYFGSAGVNRTITVQGASEVLGASAPAPLAYFAEGYTGGYVGDYLTIENPSLTATATIQVSFLPQNGSPATVQTYVIGPHSRFTLYSNTVMPNQWFAMSIVSTVPVVAERPMYFNYNGSIPGGTDVVGYQP